MAHAFESKGEVEVVVCIAWIGRNGTTTDFGCFFALPIRTQMGRCGLRRRSWPPSFCSIHITIPIRWPILLTARDKKRRSRV
jgi:hypothetical protein